MWCNIYVFFKKIIDYNIFKKLESLNMFWYDLKLWYIFKTKHKIWQNLCTFKILYFSKFDCKKTWHIGATINTIYKKVQNISFENFSLEKHVFWEKWLKKG